VKGVAKCHVAVWVRVAMTSGDVNGYGMLHSNGLMGMYIVVLNFYGDVNLVKQGCWIRWMLVAGPGLW
jgi:hypothetical protein